jgi:hypothetical protein
MGRIAAEKERACGVWCHIVASFSGEFCHFLPILVKRSKALDIPYMYMYSIPQVDHIKALVYTHK